MNVIDEDVTRGLYRKFNVSRADGRSEPGEKHGGCEYFVLDLHCDHYAIPALKAYEKACKKKFPSLAMDLRRKIKEMELWWAHRIN